MFLRKRKINNILFFVGFLICLLPILLNVYSQHHMDNVISSFYQKEDRTSQKRLDQELNRARLYNENLYLGKEKEVYDDMLNYTSTSVMATIQIPVIDVDLAVYHGTSDEILNTGIGHFEFTSLPVGGKNSHCILTGHRGLPSAKLFTRLDELKKKDQIYIHVCKKTLVYEVVDSFVVEPEDILDMTIEKDQDLLSLVTCTPYGINTKRLVVKAKRIFPKKKNQPRKSYSMREFLFLIIPVVFLIVFKVVRR